MKRYVLIALAVVVGAVCLFIWKHRPVEVTKTATEKTQAIVISNVQEHRTVTSVRAKDGTVRTVTVVDKGTDTLARSSADRSVTMITKPSAQYRARINLGWNPRDLTSRPSEVTLGAERRMLGPVWAGAWVRQEFSGHPVSAAGVSVSVEF